jgi:hypothetical protein
VARRGSQRNPSQVTPAVRLQCRDPADRHRLRLESTCDLRNFAGRLRRSPPAFPPQPPWEALEAESGPSPGDSCAWKQPGSRHVEADTTRSLAPSPCCTRGPPVAAGDAVASSGWRRSAGEHASAFAARTQTGTPSSAGQHPLHALASAARIHPNSLRTTIGRSCPNSTSPKSEFLF